LSFITVSTILVRLHQCNNQCIINFIRLRTLRSYSDPSLSNRVIITCPAWCDALIFLFSGYSAKSRPPAFVYHRMVILPLVSGSSASLVIWSHEVTKRSNVIFTNPYIIWHWHSLIDIYLIWGFLVFIFIYKPFLFISILVVKLVSQ
jgi:hypothetical protein